MFHEIFSFNDVIAQLRFENYTPAKFTVISITGDI
jgi:hypothetical protein